MDRKGLRGGRRGGTALSAEGHQVKPTGILGNGGPGEEMVIPKAVIHRKGIHHPLDVCVCVCVFTMMSSHQSPGSQLLTAWGLMFSFQQPGW